MITALSEMSAEDIPIVSLKKPKLLSQIDSDVLNLFHYGILPSFGPLTNIHLRAVLSKPFQCGELNYIYFLIHCIHSLVKITGSWGESAITCSAKLFKSLFILLWKITIISKMTQLPTSPTIPITKYSDWWLNVIFSEINIYYHSSAKKKRRKS